MSRRKRKRFEEHLLGCEDCWREVAAARAGRSIVESGRELSPQHLRESIRSTVAAIPHKRKAFPYRRLGLSVAAAVVVALFGFATLTPDQPREIGLAVAHFEGTADLGPDISSDMPVEVEGMSLVRSEAGMMGTLEVTAHTYTDEDGHTMVVYSSNEEWPRAHGAEELSGTPSWKAELDGTVVFCSNKPVPSLVLGDAEVDVMKLAEALDLR